jgi:hypothetical protein
MAERAVAALKRYLSGCYQDAPDSIKSWARLHIHREAVRILTLPLADRRAEIEKYGQPELLKAEIIRVNRLDKGR